MFQAFLASGRIGPRARGVDVGAPQQAAAAARGFLYVGGAHGEDDGAVGADAAEAPGAAARADAVQLEGFAAAYEPARLAGQALLAHRGLAARARVEDLVAQRGDFGLVQALCVR